MTKKIQITADVIEGTKTVSYESGKHDSISLAEKDIHWMIEQTKAQSNSDVKITVGSYVYNIVEDYGDEMTAPKYASFV